MKKTFLIGNKALCLFIFVFILAGMIFAGGGSQSGGSGQVTELHGLLRAGQGNLGDIESNPTLAFINQATGIRLIADQVPVDNPNEKLNAVLASGGGGYDFICVSSLERYAFYATSGALFDMGAVWKDYPNLQSTLQSSIDLVTVNNTWYCVPNFSPSSAPNSSTAAAQLMWRSDILAKMGKELPTTLDEFTALLQYYKDTDPMGNGAANVPLVGDLQGMRMNGVGGAFGVELNWKDQGGTLIPYQTQTGFFEYINYMHDLYVRGLLDRETPTNTYATMNQKFTTDRALVITRGWGDVIALVSTFGINDAREKMAFSQPLERNGMVGLRAAPKGLLDYVAVIPRSSRNWQVTMEYFNKKMDPVIFKEMTIGQEGRDWSIDAQGVMHAILPTFDINRTTANQYLTGTRPEYNTYWLQCRVGKNMDQYWAYQLSNSDFVKFITIDVVEAIPSIYYKDINVPLTNTNNMTNEFLINAVVNGITRADFDRFGAEWRAQGGDELSRIYNGWYKSR